MRKGTLITIVILIIMISLLLMTKSYLEDKIDSLIGTTQTYNSSYNYSNSFESKVLCKFDSDCVPASCCHPNYCVNKENAPSCFGMFCTMECKVDTLDCGQGICSCVNNKCLAKLN